MIVSVRRRAPLLVVLATLLFPGLLVAAGLYKWIDKDGKVHYSSTPPSEAPRTETRLSVPNAPADVPLPQAERDDSGNCQTVKCMADQMEADRLARERGYAQRRAENERATRKPVATTQPQVSTPIDQHLQENCRNGLFYGPSSRVDCNDIATLRQQWERHQMDIQSGIDAARRRGDYRYDMRH